MLWNKPFFICIIFILEAFCFSAQKPVFAASFDIIESMDFGKLIASSGGGGADFSIVLSKEELEDPTEQNNGLWRLSGGKIGIIRYVPSTEEEQVISIDYPNDYYLDGEEKVCLRYMHKYSTTEVPMEEARPFFDIEIGAELHVDPKFRGRIKGSVPIIIHINYE